MSSTFKTSSSNILYKVIDPGTSNIALDTIIDSTGVACNDNFKGLEIQRVPKPVDFYLTFRSTSGNVSVTPVLDVYGGHNSGWDATTKEYSVDNGTTWNTYTSEIGAVSSSTVMFRGLGGTFAVAKYAGTWTGWNITGVNVSVSGNLETILDYQAVQNGQHPSTATSYAFEGLFAQSNITSAENLIVPDVMTWGCLDRLFFYCTSLTTAPALPATTLASVCYQGMFSGCTSLTTPPSLPATTLADYCYYYMFSGCTSLTTPPVLPVTTLAESCYNGMFQGCSSLTTAPALPATTLTNSCYGFMFQGCTSLYVSDTSGSGYDKPWRIPATGTFTNTYSQTYMFTSCLGTRSSNDMAGASGQSYTYYTQNTPV